jgi:hypothetical protein
MKDSGMVMMLKALGIKFDPLALEKAMAAIAETAARIERLEVQQNRIEAKLDKMLSGDFVIELPQGELSQALARAQS